MTTTNPTERRNSSSCHRSLSRASRQLFRQDASAILLHYFGGKYRDAPWRRRIPNEGDAAASSDTSIDPAVDKRGRRRERISLVDDPLDGLTDEEWSDLLGWAIDQSTSYSTMDSENHSTPAICPLHPKHDVLLQNDKNSFLIQRHYRAGISKFGAFSLPSGRAARTAFWLEERETYRRPHSLPPIRSRSNSVFLFQCGICDKTFVSRYYLDKHMEVHHPPHGGSDMDSAGNHLLCPADHVCDALGGTSACVEIMNEISPYYGRGTLLGKEFNAPTNDFFLSTSISSLISHLNRKSDAEAKGTDDDDPFKTRKRSMQKRQASKEADLNKVTGELRHRALKRNKLMLQVALHRQRTLGGDSVEEGPAVSDILNTVAASEEEGTFENNMLPSTFSSSCNEIEMERLFRLCHDMMLTCFGDSMANGAEHNGEDDLSTGHIPDLTNDLITQICEPLHCHHRLHRMAGHNPRHVGHWNDQWDEHHSFALGWYGLIVVLGVVIFYGCVFAASLGNDDFGNGNLPRQGRTNKKRKHS